MQHRNTATYLKDRSGFSLLELVLVLFIMGVVAAMAFPRLMPLILFSTTEGSARHLSSYGRAVMAHASLTGDEVYVYVDLGEQEYWTEVVTYPDPEEGEGEMPDEDQMEKLEQYRAMQDMSDDEIRDKLVSGDFDDLDFDSDLADLQMHDKFERFARRAMKARAENVKHDESFLDEIGGLFDEEDEFSLDDELEPVNKELKDPVLERYRFPEDAWISDIQIDGGEPDDEVIEIPMTALGLSQEVRFFVTGTSGDIFTVIWDPVSSTTNVRAGEERL
jgi:prepilin-type N-terminal cleavage/methylation domain-containing protein